MSYPQPIQKVVNVETLTQAEVVYLSIWNMDCPDCAMWLYSRLMELESVLKVDVFYKQGVGVIIFVPSMTTPDQLCLAVRKIGEEVCHYYWAEIIGHCAAKQVLRLE